ncbi:MAG: alanine racemase [Paludibacteraceae bacterium]|nr:alanine racemase [Paludibacteraceae bacterium]
MKLSEIHKLLLPDEPFNPSQEADIEYLLTDSRQLHTPVGETLFFALKTQNNDGVHYIPSLYKKGVKAFVIGSDQRVDWVKPDDVVLLQVKGTSLDALQQLAAYKRSLYHCPVIGITGSNGKTAVKEWLYQLLRDDYNIVRSPKSYNSQIGVPLSVWQMNEQTELAIFEAGISEPGEMERLERIIRPTLGVITYIGEEHGENFESLEQKRAEKMKLFVHADTVIEEPTHQNVRTCIAVLRYLGYNEEKIQQMLLDKTHETHLTVDLKAMSDNVRYFRSELRQSTKMICMVKAFGYGTGSVEVAKRLQDEGVEYLAVAVADEGVELRKAGIHIPIIIMDPELEALDLILENNLEPNIYSFQSLTYIKQAIEQKGLEHYPVHIKIDSGMHRLGFEKDDMDKLIERLQNQKAVRVVSIFSHLAGADEHQFDTFTLNQIRYFRDMADTICVAMEEAGEPKPLMHILNSAGIERFPQYQFDMVRLGIGLYGFSAIGKELKNVCTLTTTILSIKTVHAGQSIGYSRRTFLTDDRRVAVIPIGYADGFDRRLGNGNGEVLVAGKRCKVLGNVCMDLAMIDVTGVNAQVGDKATIFGDQLPIKEIADKLQTIPYEILTSVSQRVKRVYIN